MNIIIKSKDEITFMLEFSYIKSLEENTDTKAFTNNEIVKYFKTPSFRKLLNSYIDEKAMHYGILRNNMKVVEIPAVLIKIKKDDTIKILIKEDIDMDVDGGAHKKLKNIQVIIKTTLHKNKNAGWIRYLSTKGTVVMVPSTYKKFFSLTNATLFHFIKAGGLIEQYRNKKYYKRGFFYYLGLKVKSNNAYVKI